MCIRDRSAADCDAVWKLSPLLLCFVCGRNVEYIITSSVEYIWHAIGRDLYQSEALPTDSVNINSQLWSANTQLSYLMKISS